jgi:hypothetical protein
MTDRCGKVSGGTTYIMGTGSLAGELPWIRDGEGFWVLACCRVSWRVAHGGRLDRPGVLCFFLSLDFLEGRWALCCCSSAMAGGGYGIGLGDGVLVLFQK